jgi:hypothetical protein
MEALDVLSMIDQLLAPRVRRMENAEHLPELVACLLYLTAAGSQIV